MQKLRKLLLTSTISVAIISTQAFAANEIKDTLKDPKFIDQSSYALGVLMAKNIEQLTDAQKTYITYNNAQIIAGFEDSLKGKSKMNDAVFGQQLQLLQNTLGEAAQAEIDKTAIENAKAGDEFRANYAKQKGVKSTKSGILYRIEREGSGSVVKPSDIVKVNYKGTLINGKVFDSSYERGQPIEFRLDNLIPGWIEGIPLIKDGGKIELVIPPELAYGKNGSSSIPPNSTLIFDIELLGHKPSDK